MKRCLLIVSLAATLGSTGCCWRQPQAAPYGATTYAPPFATPAYAAPTYAAQPYAAQPMVAPTYGAACQPCAPVQAAPACSCY